MVIRDVNIITKGRSYSDRLKLKKFLEAFNEPILRGSEVFKDVEQQYSCLCYSKSSDCWNGGKLNGNRDITIEEFMAPYSVLKGIYE